MSAAPAKPMPHALATRGAPEPALPAVVETSAAAAAAQAVALVETRFKVALLRPRDWMRVRDQLFGACERLEFAEDARYLLEKGGSKIEGLSIRFAEEAVRWLGNMLCEAVVTFDDDERRIVRVIVTDLEANVTYPLDVVVEKTVERRSSEGREVLGRRVNSQGKTTYRVRATDDELLIKQNSLVSKGLRTGVLRFLPSDVQEEALRRIRATLTRTAKNEQSRASAIPSMVVAFAQLEVTDEMLEGYLGHPVEAITPEEFATLRGIYQAVKDGETTWEQVAQGKPQQRARPQRAVRSEGYEGAAVRTDTVDMAAKPRPTGPLPRDSYAEPEDDEALDRRLAAEEG